MHAFEYSLVLWTWLSCTACSAFTMSKGVSSNRRVTTPVVNTVSKSTALYMSALDGVDTEKKSSNTKDSSVNNSINVSKLEGKLKKQLRQTSLKYKMIEDGDHIMCCVSGGKDSATMLYLLCQLQKKLKKWV